MSSSALAPSAARVNLLLSQIETLNAQTLLLEATKPVRGAPSSTQIAHATLRVQNARALSAAYQEYAKLMGQFAEVFSSLGKAPDATKLSETAAAFDGARHLTNLQ